MSLYFQAVYGVPCPDIVCNKHYQQYIKKLRDGACVLCKVDINESNAMLYCEVTGFSSNCDWVCNACSESKYLSENCDCLQEITRKVKNQDVHHVICYKIMNLLNKFPAKILTSELLLNLEIPNYCPITFVCETIQKWIKLCKGVSTSG